MKKIFSLFLIIITIFFSSCTELIVNQADNTTLDSLLANLGNDTTIINITNIINIHDTIIINQPIDTVYISNSPLVYTLIQPSCEESTGSIIISGLPDDWLINGLNDVVTGTGNSTTVTGIISGTYDIIVTNKNGYLSPSFRIIINIPPTSPNAPIISKATQPSKCDSKGSVFLTGLPSGKWIIKVYPCEKTFTGVGENILIKGLDPSHTKNSKF